MSLLFRVIYAAHCRSTHHKLAMDALNRMALPDAERWRNLVLKHHDAYLLGAKAPDTRFKDFRNHVLHVEQNDWGGARETARLWYHRAVETLRKEHWVNGIYATGVLSHYYTDPIHPFHTGQSEAENNIHRSVEWSITKTYDELWPRVLEAGLPQVSVPPGEDWLERMVKQGSDFSHVHYQSLIEHYDIDQGHKTPEKGFDEVAQKIIIDLLGYAVAGWSRILDRLFLETAITPPPVSLTIPTVLATLETPIQFLAKRLLDARDRTQVQAMYQELKETGRVEKNLPEDIREVRELFHADCCDDASPKSAKPKHDKAAIGQAEKQFYLEPNDSVENAPAIGPKTAKRLEHVQIGTVQDLLNADPDETATRLNVRHITAEVLRDWQDQAILLCRVPKLRGHDAQILVACGYRDPLDISTAPPEDLLKAAIRFAKSSDGERVIRSGKIPDLAEVANWQVWATEARDLKAA